MEAFGRKVRAQGQSGQSAGKTVHYYACAPSVTLLACARLLQVSASEAEARIKAANEPYKLEILESIRARDPNATITLYHIGERDHPMHW